MTAKKPVKIDLALLDTRKACNVPFKLELKHPTTKEPLGVFIYVLGKDSDIVDDYVNDDINRSIRESAAASKRGEDSEVRTVEKGIAKSVELLTVAIHGSGKEWENFDYNGQSPFPFTVGNIKQVLTEQRWVRDQVDRAVSNLENFMKA